MNSVRFEVIGGPEGPCLAVFPEGEPAGERIAGPKPWGSGSVLYSWEVTIDDLIKALPADAVAEARAAL
jgi:hypothetical protein